MITTLRPRFAAGFSGCWNCVSSPQFLSRIRIETRNESPDSKLPTGSADHHHASGDERRERNVIPRRVLGNLGGPDFAACFRIEGNDDCFAGGKVNLVAVQRYAATCIVCHPGSLRAWSPILTENISGLRIESDDLVVRSRYKHHSTVH